ncbi:anti-sigma factor [Brevibacillus choshinensis]|uniref:anti-sigma factor n=1 Tax=Brevibacillus choshinensis TaxID=54911 RepID=UPI002E1AB0CC|nr:anti-sigma factor [Brevibacillus choshinensis]
METRDRCSLSDELVAYVIGECTQKVNLLIDDHLAACPFCRQEVNELREAWALIPFQLSYQPENVDVPVDLKTEVMNAIFEPKEKPDTAQVLPWYQQIGKRLVTWPPAPYRFVMAGLAIALAGVIWNNIQLQQQLAAHDSFQPAQVVQSYTLLAPLNAPTSAKGTAWMYEQGSKKTLVLHLQGLSSTQGAEAYQVWLIHDGKRQNAGVFRVNHQGTGVLTYDIQDPSLSFEAIGITLEPDADGTQPRGKKVLGT